MRISFLRNPFARSYKVQNKEEIFKIVDYKQRLPKPLYKLHDLLDRPIVGYFYESELIKTNVVYHRVESILKKTKTKLYVKWLNYDSSHNSWINRDDVIEYENA